MHTACEWFNMVFMAKAFMVRRALYLILPLYCAPGAAAVTCEQLGNIALATEQFRNQGEPLQVLLVEADKLEGGGMTRDDMAKIRKTVLETYDRTRTPLEVRKECIDVRVK